MEPTELATPAPLPPVGPVESTQRISSLDALRGFALLGILLMNIVGFAMHFSAYDDPSATGGPATGANLWIWIVMHVLAEGKMRCIFSMVFGASMILLTTKAEEKGASSGDIYYRRTLWLMLFGIIHGYLLWAGDILYMYALAGLALFPFRRMRPRSLLIIGSIVVVVLAGLNIGKGFAVGEMIKTGTAADLAEKQGKKLTDEQKDAKKSWEEIQKGMKPTPEDLKKDADGWRGNLLSVLKTRAKIVMNYIHSQPYYGFSNWDVWSMMFIGMGLMKLRVLDASKPYKFYVWAAIVGYGIGIPVNSYTAWMMVKSNFDVVTHMFTGVTYDLGRLTVALGHVGLLMIAAKAGAFRWLLSRLAAVGQMAFSNYVMHSVICSTIFTGFGFGLYGKLERYQLYYVVLAIWVFQLVASPIWLWHYRFGPLEWCWRSLTYWKRQPMRIVPKT
ncbi:MAG TPA: DUF418 domain-containing protein, partial [Bryobacteraceae bacterium]|nr:DUF418 domain-containing protein [Bryobacteraceae bacterium]